MSKRTESHVLNHFCGPQLRNLLFPVPYLTLHFIAMLAKAGARWLTALTLSGDTSLRFNFVQEGAVVRNKALVAFMLPLCFFLMSCGSTSPVGTIAQVVAYQEALKGVQEAISRMNEAMRDRTSQVSTAIDKALKDTNDLLTENTKKALDATDIRINKVAREANDALSLASESAFGLETAVSEDANNALLTAANVMSGVPFINIRPFVAFVAPSKILPGASTYQLRIAGFFRHDWATPVVLLPDGSRADVTLSAPNNRVIVTLSPDFINKHEGQKIPLVVKYPAKSGWAGKTFEERSIFITVMPRNILTYKLLAAQAQPDPVYDYPVVQFSNNREAGKCSTNEDDFTKSFNDLSGPFDFITTYDKASSRIKNAGATITVSQGSNPDSQNSSSVSVDGSGIKVVLHQKARGSCDHGCPFSCSWGEGGNKYDLVQVTLQLAKKSNIVDWKLVGAPPEGALTWGQQVTLNPESAKELTRLQFKLVDNSYDPPVNRTLSLLDTYDSGVIRVEATKTGVRLTVSSMRRQ